jgi:hypothetical protein
MREMDWFETFRELLRYPSVNTSRGDMSPNEASATTTTGEVMKQ